MTLLAELNNFIPLVAGKAHSSLDAMANTAELAAKAITDKIPGDFVECGVFGGVHCALMAKAIMLSQRQESRRVHLFDSFQGIPEAGPKDAEWPGIGARPGVDKSGRLRSTGVSVCSRRQVEEHMAAWGIDPRLLVYHEGWFQETLAEIARRREDFGAAFSDPTEIAILRLDGDLYESTKVCLEHLYPNLVRGGLCIVDDYALEGCRAACLEYFDGEPEGLTEIGGGPVWWEKI